MLDHSLFGFLQAVVVVIEHALGMYDVHVVDLWRSPGQVEQPFQVGAHHAGLGRHGGHRAQPRQFLFGLGAHTVRHSGIFDALVQLADITREFISLAQFILNRSHLFPQEVLALRAIHLPLHLLVDLVFQFQDIELLSQQDADLLQAGEGIENFQDVLAFGQGHIERGCDEIG